VQRLGLGLRPYIKFCRSHIICPQRWEENWAGTRSRYGAIYFSIFPPFPLCECLPLASIPSTPAPNSTLHHCYITFIMLLSWSRGRLGQVQKCTFSLPKCVQNTQQVPQNPPECQISIKCQWFRSNIKYLAFRWGIVGFKLGIELSETGRVGFSRGRPVSLMTFCMFLFP